MKKLLLFFSFIYLLSFPLASAQNLIGTIEKTNDSLYKKSVGGSVMVPDLNNFREGQTVQFTSDHFTGKFRTYKLIYKDKKEAVLESQTSGRFSERLYINRAGKKFTFCTTQQDLIDSGYADEYGFDVSTVQGSFK